MDRLTTHEIILFYLIGAAGFAWLLYLSYLQWVFTGIMGAAVACGFCLGLLEIADRRPPK